MQPSTFYTIMAGLAAMAGLYLGLMSQAQRTRLDLRCERAGTLQGLLRDHDTYRACETWRQIKARAQ